MKKKKLTKASYKKILPAELYKNLREKKKGQGNSLLFAINTRLEKETYKELMELLNVVKVQRSAFVRYAITKYMNELREDITKAKTAINEKE